MYSKAMAMVLMTALTLASCRRAAQPDVDLSGIDLEVRIERFDQSLLALPAASPDSLARAYEALRPVYGNLIDLFANRIIRIGPPHHPGFGAMLQRFLVDTMIADLNGRVQRTFAHAEGIERQLTDAFRRARVYFPTRPTPRVFGMLSGFNLSVGIDSAVLCIGLDRYLGAECEYYTMLGIPRYMQAKMTPEHIVPDAVRAWVVGEFPFVDSVDNFAARMMWEGAVMLAVRRLLPRVPEEVVFGFTEEQMRFCRSNEERMWTTLVEQKLLFSTNALEINKYIGEAPFTTGFTQESPGRATVWLAYRIAESYMRQRGGSTLAELMMTTDYVAILNGARYRP